jgi:hypothetical protein
MPRFLIAIHHPEAYDPSAEGEQMARDIDALNEEMEAAGVRKFVGGLHYPENVWSLRPQADGEIMMTNDLYLRTDEHVAGFWVLELADMDAALEWARKAVAACRAPVEVRQFHW